MKEPIYIPEPCNVEWDAMKPCSDGRFCGSCQKVVVDFSNKTLGEIHDYFNARKGEHICGQYHERHVAGIESKWYNLLNRVEAVFYKARMPRIAVLLIGILLFITGCRVHRYAGARFASRDKKPNSSIKQASI